MKTKSFFKVLVMALIAAVGISACSGSSSGNLKISDIEREQIADAVRSEIAKAPSIDSIANTPLIVAPSIEVQNHDISRDLLKLVALTAPFVFVIVIVWLLLHFKNQNLIAKYRVVELSINNREKLPEVFYTGAKATREALNRRRLFNGMIWTAFGITGMAFFLSIDNNDTNPGIAISLLPTLIGIAKIVCYYIDLKAQNKSNTTPDENA